MPDKKGVFSIRYAADNPDADPRPSFPRFTALDQYGDPYLTGLPGTADPCEECPPDRICRKCRYSAVVKVLYCREEADAARAERRAPVPPRSLPRPCPTFFRKEEEPDPVSALCKALFQPFPEERGQSSANDPHSRTDVGSPEITEKKEENQ